MKISSPSLLAGAVLGGLLSLAGCREKPAEDAAPAQPDTGAAERVYHARGVVQSLSPDDPRRVVIDHEAMPGYMDAMIMPFKAKDAAELEGLTPGDVITFDYHVSDLSSWIENVKRTGETRKIKTGQAGGEPAAAPLLSVGDPMPDYEFVDENGAGLKLSDLHGMPVALTFVFSRCPVPEYCPSMMRKFNEVRELLAADPAAPDKFRLLTISFDTWNDTPEIMKRWGEAFGHRAGQPWSLLTTDSCCTINKIGANVGLKFGEVEGSYQHNLRTVVLDREGRIQRLFTDETWETGEVAGEIKAAARPMPENS